MSCGERAGQEREWAGVRGATVVTLRALGDCLRTGGMEVAGTARSGNRQPATTRATPCALPGRAPGRPESGVPCALALWFPPCPGPLACWVPGSSATRRGAQAQAPSRGRALSGRRCCRCGEGRGPSSEYLAWAPYTCWLPGASCLCPRPGAQDSTRLARWSFVGCSLSGTRGHQSARATLLLPARWCEVRSFDARFAPPGQIPN